MEQYLNILGIIAETIVSGGGILAIVAALIEHSKNNSYKPISFLLNKAGHLMTRGVMDEVKEINSAMEDRLEGHILEVEKSMNENLKGARQDSIDRHTFVKEELSKMSLDFDVKLKQLQKDMEYKVDSVQMENARHLMLRFEEGIIRGVEYTRDHWNAMYNLSKRYVDFCAKNDKFINSECEGAINLIQETWNTRPWEKGE